MKLLEGTLSLLFTQLSTPWNLLACSWVPLVGSLFLPWFLWHGWPLFTSFSGLSSGSPAPILPTTVLQSKAQRCSNTILAVPCSHRGFCLNMLWVCTNSRLNRILPPLTYRGFVEGTQSLKSSFNLLLPKKIFFGKGLFEEGCQSKGIWSCILYLVDYLRNASNRNYKQETE